MVQYILHLRYDFANLRLQIFGNALGHAFHVRLNVLWVTVVVGVVDAGITLCVGLMSEND